jgi:hypothetical protein
VIEFLGHGIAGTSLVVIAANNDRGQGLDLLNDGVGVGAVTDEVPKTYNLVILPLRKVEARLQCFQVRVYVAEEKVAQAEFLSKFHYSLAGGSVHKFTGLISNRCKVDTHPRLPGKHAPDFDHLV